jgi:hypothetical protein
VAILSLDLEEDTLEPREKEETVDTGNVNPSWMTPLEDFNIGTTAYRWFRLVPDYRDLDFEHCGDEGVFDPSWLVDTSYEEILGLHHSTKYSGVNWGLQQGLAPGQPFLVCFEKAVWYKSGGYDGPVEWDAEYPWEIVRVMPRKPATAAASWDRVMKAIERGEERHEKYAKALLERHLRSPNKWRLEIRFFGGSDWDPVRTLQLSLVSKFKDNEHTLARGSAEADHEKSFEQAFWDLLKNFQKAYPTTDPYLVLRLAGDRVPITKWDHLRLQGAEDHP